MKTLVKALPLLLLCSCARTAGETQMPLGANPASDSLPEIPQIEKYQNDHLEEDTLLTHKIESLRQYTDRQADFGYLVTINSAGYESISNVTWIFDSSFLVKSYHSDWANEGMEGKYEYFLDSGRVLCVYEEESYGTGAVTIEVCRNTGGYQYEEGESTPEPTRQYVSEDYLETKEAELQSYLNQLRQLLRESIVASTSDEVHKILVENEIDEGYVETIEVMVPSELYAKLVE